MLALQQTMTVPAARRLNLRLSDLLPKTLNAGQVELKVFINPLPLDAAPPGESALPDRNPGCDITHREAIDWLTGCCADWDDGGVEGFLARCREDKERELAIERREHEESERYVQIERAKAEARS